jgi:cytoskeletal protein RodZ
MHALLAFFTRPEGGTTKVSRELLEASDWAMLFTLGLLVFLLGAFAMWAWLIWRRSTKPAPHVKLLMELEEEAEAEAERQARATAASSEEPSSQAPWEQSPDWWKKADL